ncbi:MAG: enolase C-terminal domain-like protein [Candidatus Nanohaloarchaea archaeon]|nr:enolase C-terminal domain-like protein [Candidatus Nanohaloarchaea archaeon]
MQIDELGLYTVMDSRTNPTILAEINGTTAAAPSGASTGSHEARGFVPDDLDDVKQQLQDRLVGKELSQAELDQELEDLDGTQLFKNIGSVAIATSLAFRQAAGIDREAAFPYPLGNVVGGGEHGGNTAIQEFLVVPVEADSFPEAAQTNAAIYREMKDRYSSKIRGINDEGALITSMDDEKTLDALTTVADEHGARVGLDVAANELWDGDKYVYKSMGMEIDPDRQLKYMQKLVDEYDLFSVEDPFHEDDFRSHQLLRRETDCHVIGDDLFVTDQERLQQGIDDGAGNSILIKPNQAGTVTRTRKTVELAQQEDFMPVISHRSGETCDTSISDLALAWNIPIIKAGIADIRVTKLNRLAYLWQRMEQEDRQPRMAALP